MKVSLVTIEEIREAMREELDSISQFEEKLFTREEAAQFLSISLPTLNEWTKKGKIKCHQIPGTGRVYYLRSDLLNSVEECKVS